MMDEPWHVLSTVEPGYKPIYFVANGRTLEFYRHGDREGRPWRYRKLQKALSVRDRLNRFDARIEEIRLKWSGGKPDAEDCGTVD
jgi:hypothetical protein